MDKVKEQAHTDEQVSPRFVPARSHPQHLEKEACARLSSGAGCRCLMGRFCAIVDVGPCVLALARASRNARIYISSRGCDAHFKILSFLCVQHAECGWWAHGGVEWSSSQHAALEMHTTRD